MESKVIHEISIILSQNADLFRPFEHIYLFGSTLFKNHIPNDIDLLLIYSKYSDEVIMKSNEIYCKFEALFDMRIDLTVLSSKELINTNFLSKIKNYLQLK